MKKILLITLLTVLAGSLVQGQIIDSWGVRTGVVLSNQEVVIRPLDFEMPTDLLYGAGVSVFFETLTRDKLSLQIEARQRTKGYRSTVESVTVDHLNNDSIIVNEGPLQTALFNYLGIAPSLRIRSERGPATVYTVIGPYLDFLIAYSTTSPWPLPDQNKMLLGLNGGLGFEYQLVPEISIFTEINYEVDLMPVYAIQPLWVSNSAVFISLGIRL